MTIRRFSRLVIDDGVVTLHRNRWPQAVGKAPQKTDLEVVALSRLTLLFPGKSIIFPLIAQLIVFPCK